MNICNHGSKAMVVVMVIFLLGACNNPAPSLPTETAFHPTNAPIATQTLISTNTSTSGLTTTPLPTASVRVSTALPPWKKLIIGYTNTDIEIQGDKWFSIDRGVEEKFAWITLTNSTSNDQLTQVVAYLEPNEDRKSLFGEYPSEAKELKVESSLEKYNGTLKIIGSESSDGAIVFVELQIGTNLYGVQLVTENQKRYP